MTDEVKTISERLRIEADDLQFPTDTADEGSLNLAGIIHKAADLLEAEHARAEAAEATVTTLKTQLAKATEALRPFALTASLFDQYDADIELNLGNPNSKIALTVGALKRARATLSEEDHDNG